MRKAKHTVNTSQYACSCMPAALPYKYTKHCTCLPAAITFPHKQMHTPCTVHSHQHTASCAPTHHRCTARPRNPHSAIHSYNTTHRCKGASKWLSTLPTAALSGMCTSYCAAVGCTAGLACCWSGCTRCSCCTLYWRVIALALGSSHQGAYGHLHTATGQQHGAASQAVSQQIIQTAQAQQQSPKACHTASGSGSHPSNECKPFCLMNQHGAVLASAGLPAAAASPTCGAPSAAQSCST